VVESGTAGRVAALETHVVGSSAPCREHVALEFVADCFPSSTPGQFLQLQCAGAAGGSPRSVQSPQCANPTLSVTDQAFLRRPFSIADQWKDAAGRTHLMVISRTVGRGTAWLESLRPGDVLNVTGPLGRGFQIPEQETPLVLVGGGVGIPPLLYLARRLHELGRREVCIIFGAMRRDLLPVALRSEPPQDGGAARCVILPGGADYPATVTSDDGSVGMRGVVTDALAAWHSQVRPSAAQIFACGPELMLKAVAAMTRRLGLGCQLCIERNMGCGLGTCLSCVVRRHDRGRAEGWSWALACTDGPVFERDELLDYDLPAAS
jgi:dihydroorotate dehydrogenase electron transfer subunit